MFSSLSECLLGLSEVELVNVSLFSFYFTYFMCLFALFSFAAVLGLVAGPQAPFGHYGNFLSPA